MHNDFPKKLKSIFFISFISFFLASVATTALATENTADIEQVDIIYIDELNLIKQHLLAWVNSWSEGDIENYLNFYTSDYTPKGLSHSHWEKKRRLKVNKNRHIKISVMLDDISINGEADRAETTFWQDYKSNNYQDKVKKKIIWVKKQTQWLIKSETTINE